MKNSIEIKAKIITMAAEMVIVEKIKNMEEVENKIATIMTKATGASKESCKMLVNQTIYEWSNR